MVPEDYIDLKKQGASQEALLDFVRSLCFKAVQEDAVHRGKPVPQMVDSALIDMTYDMYEYALGKK